MRCSGCSDKVRPVVAIDIDGTLGEYHEHFRKFASGYCDKELPLHFNGSMPFWRWLGLSLVDYREIKMAYRQGGLKRTMPAYPGAGMMMRLIRDSGAEIWITTTRPYMRLDNIDPDTRHWMDRWGLSYDYMLYDENKYEQLANLVDPKRVVGVLDDLPEQYDMAHKLFHGRAMMIERQSNFACRRWGPATLLRAGTLLVGRVESWYREHG